MADIFDEIDEDLKRDQMQMLWARYGKIVMAVVAAVILLVGARQGYTAWQSNQSEASATAYEQALKSDDIIAALEAQPWAINRWLCDVGAIPDCRRTGRRQ
jgi:hypothetical protein